MIRLQSYTGKADDEGSCTEGSWSTGKQFWFYGSNFGEDHSKNMCLWKQKEALLPAFSPSVLPCLWTIQDQMQQGQNHIIEDLDQEQEPLCGLREATRA